MVSSAESPSAFEDFMCVEGEDFPPLNDKALAKAVGQRICGHAGTRDPTLCEYA